MVRVLPDVAALRKSFDYRVPAALEHRVETGTQVRVSLHGRRVGGWVVEDDVTPPEDVALRPLESVRGWGPPSSLVTVARWAAWRWAGPASAFLKAASSARAVTALTPPGRSRPAPATGDTHKRGTAGAEDGGTLSGGIAVVRQPPGADLLPFAIAAANLLDPGRAADGRGAPGVLVLVPGHDAAARLAARLRDEGRPVALLPDQWASARSGGCIAVGTRGAAFAPLPVLAGAVVFDVHDESYHEQRAPTWCAWEVVVERAKRDGAPCALVSPCPTLDVLHMRNLVVPSRRAEREGWTTVETVDRRGDDPRTGLYSARVVSLVRRVVERRGRVLCVLNRTGRVRLLACAACGDLARCERCRGALELTRSTEDGDRLRCRRCDEQRPVVCARCGARRLKALRVGVSRAREELEALIGARVDEVWGPPGQPPRTSAPVAVGTEALLHRSRTADVVVFLDFDAELLAPRMRASEEALALLARASRVVSDSTLFPRGGTRGAGRVLVQTRLPGHDTLVAAVSADPGRLAGAEASVRYELGLPPYRALATLSGPAADAYGGALRQAAPEGVEVNGPTDGTWWVRAPEPAMLCDLLAAVVRPPGRLRVAVDPVRA